MNRKNSLTTRYKNREADETNYSEVIDNNNVRPYHTHKSSEKSARHHRKRQNNDMTKIAIAIAAVAVCMILILVAWNMGKKHIALEDFVTIKYTGADGYAVAECVVDADGIVNRLVNMDSDDSREILYRSFADSITGSVTADNDGITNGDRLTVNVTYDKELAKSAGISVGSSSFYVRARGIATGTTIDLFENIEVIFAGISPDAYIVVRNSWDDDFLSQLTFTADKQSNISLNDEITIHCDVDEAELGRHGYLTEKYDKVYKADRLSTYAESVGQIDSAVLAKNLKLCRESIEEETADTSFRMIYKATQDKQYLYLANDETAENVLLVDMKFLKKNSSADAALAHNKVVLVLSADIVCGDSSEFVYFAYVFENGYITADGEFNMLTASDNALDYYCSTNYDELMLTVMDGSEGNYEAVGLQN